MTIDLPARTVLGRFIQAVLGKWVLDYETFVGMVLNEGTAYAKMAWAVADGYRLATTKDSVELSWYEAISETQEEAEDMAFQDNAARAEARTLAKIRQTFGGEYE